MMTGFFQSWPWLATFLLFAFVTGSLVGATLLGLKAGRRLYADKETAPTGIGGLEAAVYGLFGLLLAFSFSGAAERFNSRKALILREAQVARLVVSRIDLLPEPARTELRKLLSEYLDGTVTALSTPHDYDGLMKALREVEATGGRLLKAATAVFATDAGRPFTGLVIGPINDLLDQGLARRAAVGNHPPTAIFLMLYLVGLISAATSGVAMGGSKRVSWLHVAFFAAVVASVVTLTVDLEMPRLGIIRVTEWDALLREVAESLR